MVLSEEHTEDAFLQIGYPPRGEEETEKRDRSGQYRKDEWKLIDEIFLVLNNYSHSLCELLDN